MSEKNKDYRKHISAAKEWLGQAEKSIEQNNDIQSDLKLMLAQAELARAKEKDDVALWKKWLKWTVPWVAALGIAAGYVFFLRPDLLLEKDEAMLKNASTVQTVVETPAVTENEQLTSPTLTDNIQSSSPADSNDEAEVNEVNKENSQEVSQITVSQEGARNIDTRDRIPAEKQESTMLDEDMQRLMQKAGQTLRE